MNKKGIYKKCEICGKEIYVIKSKEEHKKFCSKDCYHLSLKGNIPWNKNLPSEQQPFFGKHHSDKTKRHLHDVEQKPHLKARGHKQTEEHKIKRGIFKKSEKSRENICPQCGKKFEVKFPCRKNHKAFCSKECSYNFRKGKNNKELFGEELAEKIRIKQREGMLGDKNPTRKLILSGKIPSNKRMDIRDKSNEIIKMYNKGTNRQEIGKIFSCGAHLILDILKENNVLMTDSERRIFLISIGKIKVSGKRLDVLEKKEEISRLYSKELLSTEEIGKIFNCSSNLIYKTLKKNNVKINLSERKKLLGHYKGEKNPTFNNWSSFNPYPRTFTKEFKLAIKQRDGFRCLKCGMKEEDSKILFKKGLDIHHIDYMKENTFKENCCVLCDRCNGKVNSNKKRPEWKKYFQSMLSERYGYKYSENGDIILNLNEEKKII